MMRIAGLLAAVWLLAAEAWAQPVLQAAIQPNARTGVYPVQLTVFAALTNAGNQPADDCRVSNGNLGSILDWDTLNPDNSFDGVPPNTPFTVQPGQTRNLLLTFNFGANDVSAADQRIDFFCGAHRAPSHQGLNTVHMHVRSSFITQADIIPIAVTASGDGVMHLPGAGTTGFMVVAAINNGPADTVVVRPGFDPQPFYPFANPALSFSYLLPHAPLTLSICETNASGQCLSAPVTGGLTLAFGPMQVRTFTVFAKLHEGAGLPFYPDINRVFVSFKQSWPGSTAIIGLASVAIEAPAPSGAVGPAGIYNLRFRRGAEMPEDEWPMVAFVSPTGKFAAYGGAVDSNSLRQNLVSPLEMLTGRLAFTQQGQDFSFIGSQLQVGAAYHPFGQNDRGKVDAIAGVITPRLSVGGGYTTGSDPSRRLRGLGKFRGVAMTDFYNSTEGVGAGVSGRAGSYGLYGPSDIYLQPQGTATVQTNGAITGSFRNCPYSGTITRPVETRNLFEMTLTFGSCSAPEMSGRTVEGVGAVYDELFLPWGGAPTGFRPRSPLVMVLGPLPGAPHAGPGMLIFDKTS